MLLGFGGGLPLAELVHRLFEHLGVGDQVVAYDGLDVAALGVVEALRGRRQRRGANAEREQGRGEKTKRWHGKILVRGGP
ncbi:hypothetical protein ACVW1C_000432 [Bradyrhizobium sp. USDA 4011]